MSWLSPYERRTLQVMLKFRDDPPTLAGMVVANWKIYLFLFGWFTLVGTGIGATLYFGQSFFIFLGCVIGGVLLGTLLRDFASMKAAASSWTVTREVIDWSKVRQLLGEDVPMEEDQRTDGPPVPNG